MVGKLLKYEFKESYLEILIINVAIIVLSALNAIIFKIGESSTFIPLFMIALVLLYIGAFIILIINIVRSFNKKLFSDEGYLTLTLPVSINQILLTKIFVNIIWIIITNLSYYISFAILATIIADNYDLFIFLEIFININPLAILLLLISTLFTIILYLNILIFVLACLNIGKIKKFKFLLGFLIFYGVNLITSWIINLLQIVPFVVVLKANRLDIIKNADPYLGFFDQISNSLVLLNFNSILWHSVFIISLYIISRYLIKNKLELE